MHIHLRIFLLNYYSDPKYLVVTYFKDRYGESKKLGSSDLLPTF